MEYVQLVCALIGVLALIFLFFWILRKVNKGILSVSGKRLKVQKGMDKKPLRTRIEEIQKIINAKETLSVQVTKCVYPNVRINLNSFTTTTSAEYGKCNIVCGPNDIEFR